MTALNHFNAASKTEARESLGRCCGSTRWVEAMLARRPFASEQSLLHAADEVWWSLDEPDFLEAFRHHPKIGGVESLRKKFASTALWASNEQSGVNTANEAVIEGLAAGNAAYEEKFGFIFIVCATGKTAIEMLNLLDARLPNDRSAEVQNAATEQAKITAIRLNKLLHPMP